MSCTFYLANGKEITNRIIQPKTSMSMDQLGDELSFSFVNDGYLLEVGDIVIAKKDSIDVFAGIIVDDTYMDDVLHNYVAFDFAFYLNKSEIVIQFNGISASEAITKLCNKVGVPVGYIAPIRMSITKIYKDETPASIIEDILNLVYEQIGVKYSFEMQQNKLCVYPCSEMIVDLSEELKYGEFSLKNSIQEMRNSIVIIDDSETANVLYTVKDATNVSKYGLLQQVESISNATTATARNVGNILFKNLNRIHSSFSVKLPGNCKARQGRLFNVNVPELRLQGQYMIKSCVMELYGDECMEIEAVLPEAY